MIDQNQKIDHKFVEILKTSIQLTNWVLSSNCTKAEFKELQDKAKELREMILDRPINVTNLIVSIDDIQDAVFQRSKDSGHFDMWNMPDTVLSKYLTDEQLKQVEKVFDIAEVGLISTEVSEAIEDLRDKVTDQEKLKMECADILIRSLVFMKRKGILASDALRAKMEINNKREKLHGRCV